MATTRRLKETTMKRYLALALAFLFYLSILPAWAAPPNASFNTTRTNDIITKGPWVDVRAFGAVAGSSATGVMTANVVAFKAALAAGKNVFIPEGNWYLNGAITGRAWASGGTNGLIQGAGRHSTHIYQMDNASNIWHFPAATGASELTIKSMTMYYGASAIYIGTNNNDTSTFNIEDCYFYKQNVAAIESDSNSNSTMLNARGNVFVTSITGMVAKKITGDYWYFDGNWVSSFGRVAFYNGQSSMDVRKTVGVPIHTAALGGADIDNSVWFVNYGHFFAFDNRLAADDAKGSTFLEQYSTVSDSMVIFERNFGTTVDYYYKFYAIPEHMIIRGNWGYGGLGGTENHPGEMWFSPTADMSYAYRGWKDIKDRQLLSADNATSSNTYAEHFFARDFTNREEWTRNVKTTDILIQGPSPVYFSGLIYDNVNATYTTGSTTYDYMGFLCVEVTGTGNHGKITMYNSSWKGIVLSANTTYTVVFDLVADISAPIRARQVYGSSQSFHRVEKGTNVLTQTIFTGALGDGNHFLYLEGLHSGDKVRIGRARVFTGKKIIDSVYTTVTGDNTVSAPSSSTLYWYPGDRWEYNNPTAGGFMGKVITNAGVSGGEVWKTWGAISP